ncbi:hypothetical protein T484DRAFT_1860405, partial [Baffinella frigidus]
MTGHRGTNREIILVYERVELEFSPNGSSPECALPDSGDSCPSLGGGPFLGFNVSIDAGPSATIYFTTDGSAVTAASPVLFDGEVIRLFETSPTSTLLPTSVIIETLLLEVVGVTGWREVGTVPALVTVKAYASVPGMKDSFPSEATYSVPPQAYAPQTDMARVAWCNHTHLADPEAGLDISPVAKGCASYNNSELACAVAERVPCLAPSVGTGGVLCSTGTSMRTLGRDGVYDGARISAGPGPTLTQ